MSCGVIVFAKVPVAGRVKTRLAPALGTAAAARLAERFLDHAVREAVAAAVGPVELCIDPGVGHPFVDDLAAQLGLPITAQGDGDLGQRMARALDRMLGRNGRALLIGTDAPALDRAWLQQAASALGNAPAVVVPTFDGGYALIGLTVSAPQLFADMTWSHAGVMQATRERAVSSGIVLAELPSVHDIDLPQDLVHLPSSWGAQTP